MSPETEDESSLDFAETALVSPDSEFLLAPEFMDNLLTLVNTRHNYQHRGRIKEVKDPDGEDWSEKLIWALRGLFSIDRVQEVSVGILIHRRPDHNWVVLGLRPPNISDFPAFSNKFILNFIDAFAHKPDRWTGVHVFTHEQYSINKSKSGLNAKQ
ncbi:MAG: hypothetical protein ACW99U_06565 [Candidatus Thorarchaeota archaeon]